MPFTPDEHTEAKDVPYFEDVRAGSGWVGQAVHSKLEKLEKDVVVSFGRLGGAGVKMQRGTFDIGKVQRLGYVITYQMSNGETFFNGRLSIAALPLRRKTPAKQIATLKMAMYMLRMALDGSWFLEQLSPGYAALIPWMLPPGGDRNLTEMWSGKTEFGKLLPSGNSTFIDGEFKEA